MNSTTPECASSFPILIFICSTAGDGMVPYNMQAFWKSLKRKSLPQLFSSTSFAVFGLGDSSYAKYNYAAKRLYNRLVQLGGTPLLERGEGDDMGKLGLYSGLYPWMGKLLSVLCNVSGRFSTLTKTDLLAQDASTCEEFDAVLVSKRVITSPCPFLDSTESSYSSVCDCTFEIGALRSFTPGDAISMRPENVDAEEFMSEVGIPLTEPNIQLFTREIDYQRPPMFHFVKVVYQELSDPDCRTVWFKSPVSKDTRLFMEKLEELSTSYDVYAAYILEPRRSTREFLHDFGLGISPELSCLPEILPRYYTISKEEHPRFSITVGLVRYKTALAKERVGLCSKFISRKKEGEMVQLQIEKSLLDLQGDILVVCTGTGISLARALFYHFTKRPADSPISSLEVVFGFRSLRYDFLYSNEMCAGDPGVISHNGLLALKYDSVPGRAVTMYAVPSRISEDIKHLPRGKPFREGDALTLDGRNYVQRILEVLDLSTKNIVVSGNSRLAKIIPKEVERCIGKKTRVQFECW